jgi:hypothetical protein
MKAMIRSCLLFVSIATALGACIPYPAELLDQESGKGSSQYALIEGAYPGLEGGNELVSQHYKVHAYGGTVAQQVSDACEALYAVLMTDSGLISFQQRVPYTVVVYGSQDEYRKKTGQPDWSPAVIVGTTIYTWYSPVLNGVLAHMTTHSIWTEYMNGRVQEPQRWVVEGLAVYEEAKSRTQGQELFAGLQPMMRRAPMPIDQLQNLAPNTERAYETSLWYAQSQSMVAYMIDHGGRIGFGQFLSALSQGQNIDQAINSSFVGQWQGLAVFDAAWRGSLQ